MPMDLTIVPANRATWSDLSTTGLVAYLTDGSQLPEGQPRGSLSSAEGRGPGVPVGWVAVEPRTEYPEGYAMRTRPGREITWGELHVGAVQAVADAGFTEVSSPSVRRAVMRVDFGT
jgi:hypothetical protein